MLNLIEPSVAPRAVPESGLAHDITDLEDSLESDRTGWAQPGGIEPSDLGRATPPRIDSVNFARTGEAICGERPLSSMPRLLAAGVSSEGGIQWMVRGFSGLDDLQRRREFLDVRTRFTPVMTCSSCLEPVLVPEVETTTRFRLAASEEQAAREDKELDREEVMAADSNLDLSTLLEDEAILALPMAPSHPGCLWNAADSIAPDDV